VFKVKGILAKMQSGNSWVLLIFTWVVGSVVMCGRKPLPDAFHGGVLVCVFNLRRVFWNKNNFIIFCENPRLRNNFVV
jgi:hypothetical protein